MKAQQKIDKILDIVNDKVEEEVSALIGADFKLSKFSKTLFSKQEYIDDITGKKILAHMDITGELEGKGCLIVNLKDGIRLGGILIMLPQNELEDVILNEEYNEETEDSYGEIANIIAGAFTKVFEENYPKNFRFIRKEQELLIPAKVDIESDTPFAAEHYYLVRGTMQINGVDGGDLDFLMPAEPFGLVIPEEETSQYADGALSEGSTKREDGQKNEGGGDAPETTPETPGHTTIQEPYAVSENVHETRSAARQAQYAKNKQLVDKLLTLSREQYADEVSALLGASVKLTHPENTFIDKESFFYDEVSGKQVLAEFDIVDGLEGKAHFFISLKDAVRFGSILIMLPPSERETAVSKEDFSPDIEDAYGEIANIISGGYTSVFQENYIEPIRFIKKGIETVSPMKVDVDSDDVIPRLQFYMSSCDMEIDGTQCGRMGILLPADVFGLAPDDNKDIETTTLDRAVSSDVVAGQNIDKQSASGIVPEAEEIFDVLLIHNHPGKAKTIADEMGKMGVTCKSITFNDSIKKHVSEKLRLVLIVMNEVDEQSYGVAIKVNTLTSVPIVAASAQWTRTKVIKAVKYGVVDILLLPAAPDDIKEKIRANMLEMAA